MYKTNRYGLVFVPFTGIDNHKKCVTFAAALIAREDVESYRWALNNFKKTMGSTPAITVTDQDPAMKVAIAKEFPETRHRYCMWHIMTKVGDKVSSELAKNEEFRRELNSVVWNDSSTSEYFEIAWNGVIEKKQRLKQTELSAACNGHTPPLKTQLRIEQETASLYTLTVFYEVQDEICAGCFSCRVRTITHGETVNTYVVEDEFGVRNTIHVENGSMTTTCACRMYKRVGLLCRHAFAVFMDERIDHIPPQHITPRWTRTAIPKTTGDIGNEGREQGKYAPTGNKEESNVINKFYGCLGMAQGNVVRMQEIEHVLDEFKTTWGEDEEGHGAANKGKQDIIESYCGIPAPETDSFYAIMAN
ncbi:PREDICTED: protein FAR1-RELATED SEQUENCE 5-like [Ipomoea nil]|uniref:protein FAR1-RELATED SEQUENCE 5-like n=1 Tax=Ipomoea nil TaxID=35883 RepID=UPI000901EF3D|nr:PREDICTED: protein FAR1-RELATED SEQUENCE 5-like [Ipomoea nil]